MCTVGERIWGLKVLTEVLYSIYVFVMSIANSMAVCELGCSKALVGTW